MMKIMRIMEKELKYGNAVLEVNESKVFSSKVKQYRICLENDFKSDTFYADSEETAKIVFADWLVEEAKKEIEIEKIVKELMERDEISEDEAWKLIEGAKWDHYIYGEDQESVLECIGLNEKCIPILF